MSAHNDPGFLHWLIGGAVSMAGGLFGYHKYLDSRFAKKANREDVQEVRREVEKLRDEARENEQRAQDRHERLMDRLTGERNDHDRPRI
jgi:hypothetical protein